MRCKMDGSEGGAVSRLGLAKVRSWSQGAVMTRSGGRAAWSEIDSSGESAEGSPRRM